MSHHRTAVASFPSSSTLAGGLFPAKLHDMLEYADQVGLASSTIAWTSNGLAFIVFDPNKLVDSLLGIFFEQTKYRSFLRQLTMWSFERTSIAGNGLHGFRHPYFIRGQKPFFENMSREVFRTSTNALATTRSQSVGLGANQTNRLRRSKALEATRSPIDVKVNPKRTAGNQNPLVGTPASKRTESNKEDSQPMEFASVVPPASATATQPPRSEAKQTSSFDSILQRALEGGSEKQVRTINANVSQNLFWPHDSFGGTASFIGLGSSNISNQPLNNMLFFSKLPSTVDIGKGPAVAEERRRKTVDTGALARALLQNEQIHVTNEAGKTPGTEEDRLEFAGKSFYSLDV